MVIFTDRAYQNLLDTAEAINGVKHRIKGHTITKDQRYQLEFLVMKLKDQLMECQR